MSQHSTSLCKTNLVYYNYIICTPACQLIDLKNFNLLRRHSPVKTLHFPLGELFEKSLPEPLQKLYNY